MPKTEISVVYYPWFYEQVEDDNIKTHLDPGTEIRGELRKEQLYQASPTSSRCNVKRFVTYVPSEAVDRRRSSRS